MFDLQGQASKYYQLVARAWRDEGFKRRLLSDPLTVLKEHGLQVPEETKQVKVVEDTPDLKHFVLPAKVAHFTEENVPDNLICCC